MAANGRAERFRVHSIEYRPAERPKAEIYRDFLPILRFNGMWKWYHAPLTEHRRFGHLASRHGRGTARPQQAAIRVSAPANT
jgi:hypothetical protein